MQRETFDVVMRRLAFYKGSLLITTTPYSFNFLKTEIYDKWVAKHPDVFVYQAPSTINPFYPKEEFEKMKKSLPEWKFRMFYCGEFVRPEGLVYDDFDRNKHTIQDFQIPKQWRRFVGVDFGYNNPTAIVWVAHDPTTDEYYVYREVYKTGMTTSEVIDRLKYFLSFEHVQAVYCDSADPNSIQMLKEENIPAKGAKKDTMAGIMMLIELFRQNKLKIFKSVVNLLDEIEMYHWDSDGTRPVKEHDHTLDALRYAITGYKDDLKRRPVVAPDGINSKSTWVD